MSLINNLEGDMGSNDSGFAKMDGGGLFVSATISDIRGMQGSASTKHHLPEVALTGFSGGLLGTGSWNRQNNSDKLSETSEQVPLVDFDRISDKGFQRWPFMPTRGDDESLHKSISDHVKEGMNPKDRTELEKQEKDFHKEFKSWSMMAGIAIKPPDMKDYPLLAEHNKRVNEVEQGITKEVFSKLTPSEKKQLEQEDNPLGPGLAPKPMRDEVVKRIREQTRKYLNNQNPSQREHNRI